MPAGRRVIFLLLLTATSSVAAEEQVLGSMQVARAGHTATALPSGKILVAGGEGTGSAEIYDPVSDQWTLTGSMSVGRIDHTATLLEDGRLLVAGGDTAGTAGTAEIFDPATGKWSGTGALIGPRVRHTATLLPAGKVLVAGGGTKTAEIWDPQSGMWSQAESMSTSRDWHTATSLPTGEFLVVGGDGSYFGENSSAELFDPNTGHWRNAGTLSDLRSDHAAALLADGRVLVAGGEYIGPHPNYIKPQTAEIYDPAMNTWTPTGSMGHPHAGATLTLLPNGRALVVGCNHDGFGEDVDLPESRITEIYDPADGTWRTDAELATGRWANTTSILPSGKVLVAGGLDQKFARLASTELLDPVRLRTVPDFVTISPKGSTSFSATGGWGHDFRWDVLENGSGATLTPDGHYTAGAKDHSTDVVRVTDSIGNFATATVAVTSGDQPGGGQTAGPQPGCHAAGDGGVALFTLTVLPLFLSVRRGAPWRRSRN